MSGLNWEKDRRSQLWRHGRLMQRQENAALERAGEKAPRLATAKQIKYLRQLLLRAGRIPPSSELRGLTLGEAATWISQLSAALRK